MGPSPEMHAGDQEDDLGKDALGHVGHEGAVRVGKKRQVVGILVRAFLTSACLTFHGRSFLICIALGAANGHHDT
jgi:hypothetical protein